MQSSTQRQVRQLFQDWKPIAATEHLHHKILYLEEKIESLGKDDHGKLQEARTKVAKHIHGFDDVNLDEVLQTRGAADAISVDFLSLVQERGLGELEGGKAVATSFCVRNVAREACRIGDAFD